MSVNARLKATKIIGQRKPESSCARKETVDIDTLVTLGMVTEKSCNLSK